MAAKAIHLEASGTGSDSWVEKEKVSVKANADGTLDISINRTFVGGMTARLTKQGAARLRKYMEKTK